jgi:RND family efflux transporter MFP subunit
MSLTTNPLSPSQVPANPQLPGLTPLGTPLLTQPGSSMMPPGSLLQDRGVDTSRSLSAKRKVPVWYRRSRTFWAGGAILILTGLIGGGLRWKFGLSTPSDEITATVKRADLPITVTEKGELESSKTIDVRCEVEGRQNKIVSILPESTPVKGPGWFWWEPAQVVVTFDADELTRQYMDQKVKYKTAVGKAKAAEGELEVQKNKAEGDIAKARLDLALADLDRDKYLGQDSVPVKKVTITGMVSLGASINPCAALTRAAYATFYFRPIVGEYQADVIEKNGDIEMAKKELQEAKEKFEQYEKLVRKGFGTPETLRGYELNMFGKQFVKMNKEAKLKVLQDFLRKRQEEELTAKAAEAKRILDRAEKTGTAAVEKAQSELEAAQVTVRLEEATMIRFQKQLDKCTVRAPADGILNYSNERFWDPSSKIQAGAMVFYQQLLFRLPDLNKMQVKVKIHESMIKKVRPGQKAEITIDALSHVIMHGVVQKVSTMSENTFWEERGVKEYITIVKIDDLPPDADLKPGMTAQVKILANRVPDVLLVPVQAVAENDSKHYAYVVGPYGTEQREVEVGENNEKYVEVKSGLEEGEKVALDARARITAETKASEKKGLLDELKPGEKNKEEKKEDTKPAQPTPAPAQAAPVAAAPARK